MNNRREEFFIVDDREKMAGVFVKIFPFSATAEDDAYAECARLNARAAWAAQWEASE